MTLTNSVVKFGYKYMLMKPFKTLDMKNVQLCYCILEDIKNYYTSLLNFDIYFFTKLESKI